MMTKSPLQVSRDSLAIAVLIGALLVGLVLKTPAIGENSGMPRSTRPQLARHMLYNCQEKTVYIMPFPDDLVLSSDHFEAISAVVRDMHGFAVTGVRLEETGLGVLANQEDLESMTIQNTKLTGAGLKQIAKIHSLHELYLCAVGVTDGDLPELKDLTNLRSLYLSGNRITSPGVAKLRSLLPSCEITSD